MSELEVAGGLGVAPKKEQGTYEMSWRGESGAKAERVVEAVVGAYGEIAQQRLRRGHEALRSRLMVWERDAQREAEEARREWEIAEREAYEAGIVAPQYRAPELARQVAELERENLKAEVERRKAERQQENIRRMEERQEMWRRGLVVPPQEGLYRGEVPPDLVESLRQLEVRMRGLARRVTEEHPQYVEIRSEIEAVREQIAEEMRRRPVEDMGVLEQRRRMLEATEEFLGALIQARNEELTRVEAHRGRIERAETRMREAEQRLDGVRAKRREVEASEPAEEMVDVVSAARAGKAAGLEARTVAMMVVIAIVVGVALGFVVEYLSDVIRSSVDVKTYTGWEVVGGVPRQREGGATLLRVAEQSALWEAYNKIAVYLEEGLREMGKKVVGVSSVLVGEGKTTVAVNAGVALARSGRKVLVVDGDMRRGALHEQAGVESEPGWAEVLSGEKEVEEVVRPGPVDGMGVVPRGRRPANALMLLSSQRLREVLARLEEQRVWDVVIVDLPPMLGLVDAVWVGGRGVPLVMVMREGMVRRSQAAHVKGELGRLKAKVLGVVLNAVRETESEYYYYYYYHRYQSK